MKAYLTFLILLCAFFTSGEVFPSDAQSLIGQGDVFWEGRGTKENLNNDRALEAYRKAATIDTYNYEAYWKVARSCWWISDQMIPTLSDNKKISGLAQEGMEHATRAALIEPEAIEGRLYLALSALHYFYGVGAIVAMKEGKDAVIEEHLDFCYKHDKAYDNGIIPRSLSSYYRVAPWPIRDVKASLRFVEEAVSISPTCIRNLVYLAASYDAIGETDKAMDALKKAAELEGDPALEPDSKYWKKYAEKCLKERRILDPEKLL